MQGNLQEFNIRSILQFIELGQHTGTLYLEYKPSWAIPNIESDFISFPTDSTDLQPINSKANQFFLLYFVDGKITYATTSAYDRLLRIYDYLQYLNLQKDWEYLLKKSIDIASPKEYIYIWQLLQKKSISSEQALIIIRNLIKETFWVIADLNRGNFVFRKDYPITPEWNGLTTSLLVPEIFNQLRRWKQFFPQIQSPHQYLVLSDVKQLSDNVSPKTYKTLSSWSEKKLSLLRLSRQLNYSLADLAKVLYPCIQKGWIKLTDNQKQTIPNFTSIEKRRKTHIVYLADEMTIDRNVEYILKQKGYNSTLMTIPTATLTTLMEVQPDLIICDWDMLQPDGYEICSMLQNSPTLRQVPIVAISGQEDYLTKLRTKILSLAYYLSKPFTQNELLMVVEQSLNTVYQSKPLSLGQSSSVKSIVQH